MSNQGKDQPDDRTILDPLNADELRALREARAKLQGAAAGKGVGPDTGEDLGNAQTRHMPAVPGVSLENLGNNIMPNPKPMTPESARIAPQSVQPNLPQGVIGQGGGAGGGFGENTLMWMAPVQAPEAPQVIPERGAAAAAGMTPTAIQENTPQRKALMGVVGVGALALVGLIAVNLGGSSGQGVVELVTNPGKAAVKIDGKEISLPTPMKATLPAGKHEVEVSLQGFRTETFQLDIGDKEEVRRTIEMHPLSEAGKLTLSIQVSPVAANIRVDDQSYGARKNLKVANVDPKAPHKVVIEAGGYKKIEQEIAAGQLKEEYNFVLQKDAEPPPGG